MSSLYVLRTKGQRSPWSCWAKKKIHVWLLQSAKCYLRFGALFVPARFIILLLLRTNTIILFYTIAPSIIGTLWKTAYTDTASPLPAALGNSKALSSNSAILVDLSHLPDWRSSSNYSRELQSIRRHWCPRIYPIHHKQSHWPLSESCFSAIKSCCITSDKDDRCGRFNLHTQHKSQVSKWLCFTRIALVVPAAPYPMIITSWTYGARLGWRDRFKACNKDSKRWKPRSLAHIFECNKCDRSFGS